MNMSWKVNHIFETLYECALVTYSLAFTDSLSLNKQIYKKSVLNEIFLRLYSLKTEHPLVHFPNKI